MSHIIHLNSFSGSLSKDRKRVGRGIGSGRGGTSGAGHKGQSARSGTSSKRRHAEFARRLPKVGFKSRKPDMSILTLTRLSQMIERGALSNTISISDLVKAGVSIENGLKLIGVTEKMGAVTIQAHKISAGAKECLEKHGGTVELVGKN